MWYIDGDIMVCDRCNKGLYIVDFSTNQWEKYYPWYCPYCGRPQFFTSEKKTPHEKSDPTPVTERR